MSRGVNKAIIVGHLGMDPETRYTVIGACITTCSVATSEQWKDKETGEKQERTEWHRLKFFGRLAEIAGEYLRKGAQVYVEGSIRTEKWTDKEGIERYSTWIVVNELQMLGGAGGGTTREQPSSRDQARGDAAAEKFEGRGGASRGGANRGGAPQNKNEDFSDDDIPFN